MQQEVNFSQGKILGPLVRFALPVLAALFLQSMYGAVDLLVVGQFSAAADVSAVATGAQIMLTLTNLISALAMGLTIILGQQIGLATPCSSAVQIIMCLIAMYYVRKKVIPHCQSSEKSAR